MRALEVDAVAASRVIVVNARKRRSGRAEPERLLPCEPDHTIVSPKRVDALEVGLAAREARVEATPAARRAPFLYRCDAVDLVGDAEEVVAADVERGRQVDRAAVVVAGGLGRRRRWRGRRR